MTARASESTFPARHEFQTEVGTYREICEPERLVFTHAWVRAAGTSTPTTLVTVTFAGHDAGTEVAFTQSDFHSAEFCRSHAEGWSQVLDQLTQYVPRL
jgi:uncharacterized protein YndB with AHSA1/START domain